MPPRHPPAVAAVLAATTIVQALLTLSCLALPSIAPKVGEALGVDPSLIGLQVSIVYGGAMFTSLAGGTVVRRYGACRASQAALLFAVAGSLLAAVPWLPALALASVLIGLGYGLTNPAGSHLLANTTSPKNRNLIFSIRQTGVPLGGLTAGLMAPAIAVSFGWQWTVVAVAAMALAMALLLQAVRAGWDGDRDPHMRLRHNPLSGLGLVWRRPPLRWMSLGAFCFSVVQLCLSTFLVTMLVTDVRLPLVEAGVVLAAVQVAGVGGRVLWGWVADRVGNGQIVLACLALVMAAAAAVTGMLSPEWPPAAVLTVLLIFGVSAIGWNGVYLAEVARMAPIEQVSRITGASLFFTFAGVLVGPTAFTLLYGRIGSYTTTYALLAALALTGLALVLVASRARGAGGSPAPGR